ncbi:MAG: 4-oxalocrotonate tautomerase family protein [Proteobacteria bacterium]|nr:4-oxalocrotonate tautomerase family protein [Pseudomonadota bacterium]
MPVIQIDIGKINSEQKKLLIETLTKKAVEVTKIPIDAFSVIINEHEDENYGVGGLTLDKIKKH